MLVPGIMKNRDIWFVSLSSSCLQQNTYTLIPLIFAQSERNLIARVNERKLIASEIGHFLHIWVREN